jgi:hypothetical protein
MQLMRRVDFKLHKIGAVLPAANELMSFSLRQ